MELPANLGAIGGARVCLRRDSPGSAEPFGALDPVTRDTLGSEYRRLHETMGLTTVMVTHDVMEAVLLGDRIIVVRQGEIVADGEPYELFHAHPDAGVRALMDMPRRQAERVRILMQERAERG